jgi:hypothetical protein
MFSPVVKVCVYLCVERERERDRDRDRETHTERKGVGGKKMPIQELLYGQ